MIQKHFAFYPKFAIIIGLVFIFLTIIGTQLHEIGHLVVAKSFGYETQLHYRSMNKEYKGYFKDEDVIKLQELNDKYLPLTVEELENLDDSIKKQAEMLIFKIDKKFPYNKTHDFWITLGGPLQTILTSFIGLLILWCRKSKHRTVFGTIDWLGVLLGLFILREVFNTVYGLIKCVLFSNCYFNGDEFRLSQLLELNQWVLPLITTVFGSFIAYHIIFKVIPKQYQFTFIIAGFIGGLSGYALWFGGLGEFCYSLYN